MRLTYGTRLARKQGKIPQRIDSTLEAEFAKQCRAFDLPPARRNYRFLDDRELEFDWAWPDVWFAVEIQGDVHRIKENFHRDVEKQALALLEGWILLPVDRPRLMSGRAIQDVQALLARRAVLFGVPNGYAIPPLTMPRPAGIVCPASLIHVSDDADKGAPE